MDVEESGDDNDDNDFINASSSALLFGFYGKLLFVDVFIFLYFHKTLTIYITEVRSDKIQ